MERKHDCTGVVSLNGRYGRGWQSNMVTVKSNQKIFTEQEVSGLTGICLEHLPVLARTRNLGFIAYTAEAASEQAEQRLFTSSDLMVLAILFPRCQH
jgi:hypothetical protein